jgi:hypothetical protein
VRFVTIIPSFLELNTCVGKTPKDPLSGYVPISFSSSFFVRQHPSPPVFNLLINIENDLLFQQAVIWIRESRSSATPDPNNNNNRRMICHTAT